MGLKKYFNFMQIENEIIKICNTFPVNCTKKIHCFFVIKPEKISFYTFLHYISTLFKQKKTFNPQNTYKNVYYMMQFSSTHKKTNFDLSVIYYVDMSLFVTISLKCNNI